MKTVRYLVRRALSVFFLLQAGQSVVAQLHADFSSSQSSGCAPVFVQFTDKSAGGATELKWDLGNGAVSYLQNPSATYFNPGKYTIKLVIRKGNLADSVLRIGYITISAIPKAGLLASDTTGCFPLTVQFSDQSNPQEGSIIKREWDLGDGTVSSLANPSHVYTGPGSYNVVLRVTNSAGCVNTIAKAQYIKLKDGVNAAYSITGSNQCNPPSLIQFNNKSTGTGTVSYQWNFGDGGISAADNPSHTYQQVGTYTIRLIAKNSAGCIDTLIKKDSIVVGANKAKFTVPDSACQGVALTLFNSSTPAPGRSHWNFGNGRQSDSTNPVIVYPGNGIYPLSLVVDFGSCRDSIGKNIKILPKLIAAFTADKTATCHAPLTVKFQNQAPGASGFLWLFGDGTSSTAANPTHTYTSDSSYMVTLVVTSAAGCTDSLKEDHYINVLPPQVVIKDLPASGCAPFVFTPSYIVNSKIPIVYYRWDFGDGLSDTARFPSHSYLKAGIYTVTLNYITSDGCSGQILFPGSVKVGQKPGAGFAADVTSICAASPIHFSDNSTGGVTNWLWDFGDGTRDSSTNPVHTFNDTGHFSIQLIVSSNGCLDTLRKPDLVYVKPPIARFTPYFNCDDPFNYSFTNVSIAANSWTWDFGDGSRSTDRDPVHRYRQPGLFPIQLTVSNGACSHTATYRARVISESTNFIASDSVICKGDSVIFQPRVSDPANIYYYNWASNGRYDTSRIFRNKYSSNGKYTVTLATIDANGCKDTVTRIDYIQVNGPTARLVDSVNATCLKTGGVIRFSDKSVADGIHPISNWDLSFGDGSNAHFTSPLFTHAYGTAGSFTIGLKVTDTDGCTDSTTGLNTVYIGSPAANFSSPDSMSCENKPVGFVDLSTGRALTYSWSFGDGGVATDENPVHRFMQLGSYNVRLKVMDNYGCADSIAKTAYILIDQPRALFNLNDSVSSCPPLISSFSNRSAYYRQVSWDFGDGTAALVDNPVHYYNYPGTYYAKLVAISPGGCTDSMFRKIEVKGPTGRLVYDKNIICNPGEIGFSAETQNTKSLIWDFNDGSTSNTGDTVLSHRYTSPGAYVPRMILEDNRGCRVPVSGRDTIYVFGARARFETDTRMVCDRSLVNFKDASSSNDLITTYQWVFGDGQTAAEAAPSHSYASTGVYHAKLVITTLNGCADTTAVATDIKVVASPAIAMAGDTSACMPATIRLSGRVLVPDSSSLSWTWNFSSGAVVAMQNPAALHYDHDGVYPATVKATNSSGCSTIITRNIVVHPLPSIVTADQAICENKTVLLKASGASKYSWSPASSLSCGDCAMTMAAPANTTVYQVRGLSEFGCDAVDSVTILVKHPFKLSIGRGDTLCKGESFRMSAKNAESYEWIPALNLSDNHAGDPVARPDRTTRYQVIGRDSLGCFTDTGSVNIVVYGFPEVDAGPDKTIGIGSSSGLQTKISTDAQTIRWRPAAGLSCADCPNPVASPKQTTTYQLMAMNQGGCMSKDEVTVFVVCNNGNIFLPNTFSPDGNGANDAFYPRGTGLYNVRSMRIFNRWGEPVYEATNFKANDASKGWTGTYKGKPAPNDVYVYFVEVICENNAILTYSGNITLIR